LLTVITRKGVFNKKAIESRDRITKKVQLLSALRGIFDQTNPQTQVRENQDNYNTKKDNKGKELEKKPTQKEQ